MREDMKVLAIDPGYDRLGIAVVEGTASKPVVVWSDCVLPPKGFPEERLAFVQNAVEKAIQQYSPSLFALESLFFGVNKKTALKVAEARGAVLSAASNAGLRVLEIPPVSVKLAVTGNGRADKKAVAHMIPFLTPLKEKKRLDDEFDAIAVGIAALALA